MITERRPDVSPFSAIESIANWLSGTFISQPLRSRIEWRFCEGQSGALTVRKWPTTARRRHANDLLENPLTKIIEASNTMKPNDIIFVMKATARPCLTPLVASRL
jgi:hypothetical protein